MKKQLVLAAMFSVMFCMPVQAGTFRSDETGIWYERDDGHYLTGWFQDMDGSWYCFDENGYARLGWYFEDGKRYYLANANGRMFTDCVAVQGGQYYRFSKNGEAAEIDGDYAGWLWDGIYWYYRRPNGSYVYDGWRDIDGGRFYFEEGHLKTGPALISGEKYFFDDKGFQKTGLLIWNRTFYYLNDDLSLATSEEREVDGVAYVFDATGAGRVKNFTAGGVFYKGADWPYKAVSYIPPDNEKSDLFKTCDRLADQILTEIVNDGMTKRQKAEAIYAWIRANLRYSGSSATRDWVQEAYQGLRRGHGDCYTYYSVSQLLLSRVGIPSIEVIRHTDNHHYWNLVEIDGAWYHFDTCPRRAGGDFCLWTDTQMETYSENNENCFAFDRALYPRTP
ncbi:MAG: hypothetical protein HFE84_09405 [Lachnospiraceae bacterium]|nr:hypothetical protein [Lachnospiraceae bacterium]